MMPGESRADMSPPERGGTKVARAGACREGSPSRNSGVVASSRGRATARRLEVWLGTASTIRAVVLSVAAETPVGQLSSHDGVPHLPHGGDLVRVKSGVSMDTADGFLDVSVYPSHVCTGSLNVQVHVLREREGTYSRALVAIGVAEGVDRFLVGNSRRHNVAEVHVRSNAASRGDLRVIFTRCVRCLTPSGCSDSRVCARNLAGRCHRCTAGEGSSPRHLIRCRIGCCLSNNVHHGPQVAVFEAAVPVALAVEPQGALM